MRITLSHTDSVRWLSGGKAQWEVEERILEWAATHHVREAVVVALDTNIVAFAFAVDRGDQ